MKRYLLLGLVLSHAATAQPIAKADWPCVQRYVPVLTAGSYWSGPAPTWDWRDDPTIATLVAATAPRSVRQDVAVGKLQAYADRLPAMGRPPILAMVFAGLVDESNRQRTEVMDRLNALNRRQRQVAQMVEAINVPPPGGDIAVHDEIVQRRDFLTREFQETERTIRYACEVPVVFEARLGAFGRILDAAQQASP